MKKRLLIALVVVLALAATASLVWASAASLTVVSEPGVAVYGPLDHYAPVGHADWGTTPGSAVATWVHGSWPSIPGATWISTTYLIEEPIATSSWRWFHDEFELCEGAYNTTGSLVIATADNAERVWLNGVLVGEDGEVEDPWQDNYEWATILNYSIVPTGGVNELDFVVRNYPGSSNPYNNPTGLIYKAEITYDCPIQVEIDIKPGSYPNCFNVNGHGVIPVAILGSPDFDATQIDVSTLSFAGLDVRVKGNGNPQCSIEDVSGDFTLPEGAPDGYPDLVCQFVDDSTWTPDDGTATVTGNLLPEYDGAPIVGTDEICLRPE